MARPCCKICGNGSFLWATINCWVTIGQPMRSRICSPVAGIWSANSRKKQFSTTTSCSIRSVLKSPILDGIAFGQLGTLGRWTELSELHDNLFSQSLQRNDFIQRLEATSGLSAAVWLARDEPQELRVAQELNAGALEQKIGVQVFDHERWISLIQHAIYNGQWRLASKLLRRYRRLRNRSPLKRLQPFRVAYLFTGALVALHRLDKESSPRWSRSLNRFAGALRGEQLDYTTIAANMFDGLHRQRAGDRDAARRLLQDANTQAARLQLHPLRCATSDALENIDLGRRR